MELYDIFIYACSIIAGQLLSKICQSFNISFMFLLISFVLSFAASLSYFHQNNYPIVVPISFLAIVVFLIKVLVTFFIFHVPSAIAIISGISYGIVGGILFTLIIMLRFYYHYYDDDIDGEDNYFQMRMRRQRHMLRARGHLIF